MGGPLASQCQCRGSCGHSIQNARPRTDLDAEVLKSGMVRRHIPVFNAQGQEINVAEAILKNFDVVSVQLTVCLCAWVLLRV